MSDYISRTEAKNLLGVTRQRVAGLVKTGKLTETPDGIPLTQVQARKVAATLPLNAPTVLVQANLPAHVGNWYRADETRAKTVLMDAYLCRDVARQETAEAIDERVKETQNV